MAFLMACRRFQRVGAGELEDGERNRRLTVEIAVDVVVARTEFDAVPSERTTSLSLTMALPEDLRMTSPNCRFAGEAGRSRQRILKVLPGRNRRLADAPGGHLAILVRAESGLLRRASCPATRFSPDRARCACCNRAGPRK